MGSTLNGWDKKLAKIKSFNELKKNLDLGYIGYSEIKEEYDKLENLYDHLPYRESSTESYGFNFIERGYGNWIFEGKRGEDWGINSDAISDVEYQMSELEHLMKESMNFDLL
tara:strand:- start:11 stop:346 length:336 start_codon:yes stop_codon:yes gene_type:complete